MFASFLDPSQKMKNKNMIYIYIINIYIYICIYMFSDAVKKSRKVQQHFEFPVVGLDFQVFAVIKSGTGAKIIDEISIFGTKDL